MPDKPDREIDNTAQPADRQPSLETPIGQAGEGSVAMGGNSADGSGPASSSWADEVRQQGQRMFDAQKDQVAEQMGGVARALQKSAEQVRQQDAQQLTGRVLEQAASGLDQLSELLRRNDSEAVLQRVSSLMRQQPVLFMSGAVAAGFVLSRLFKNASESEQRLDETYAEPGDVGLGSATEAGRPDDLSATYGGQQGESSHGNT